jgi:deazaflavin-dependent oxidoreductase (nitroreductase family)
MNKLLVQLIVWFYQLFRGGPLSRNLLLLSTIGRKSGLLRTVTLSYIRDGNTFIVIASNAGQEDTNPDWYLNLQAHPKVKVQIGAAQFVAQADTVPETQRERLWGEVVAANRRYADIQQKTSRVFPLVRLTPM